MYEFCRIGKLYIINFFFLLLLFYNNEDPFPELSNKAYKKHLQNNTDMTKYLQIDDSPQEIQVNFHSFF